ncbi:phosphatase PAP2 family protein [Cypionkella sp. TWP1-2-1b2]|uniref:phosphatase PAP2 family protein n=1 Tax=Cypionkella sp. TWP1-2-1b2 TaxID=2804675 RepID=UPI003CF813A6
MRIVKVLIAGLVALTVSVLTILQPAAADSKDSWDKLSTALVFGLAGGAEWKTVALGDKTGQMEFFEAMAATLAVSEGLKAVIHKRRPDGSSNDSFPSAHTALAFAAASYFDIRYGAENKALVPFLYGAAALAGLGRVQAKKHFMGDVAAGALIGVALAHTFTTPNNDLSMYPTGDGMGINYVKHF